MRLSTLPEVSEIAWATPGAPFYFDLDLTEIEDSLPGEDFVLLITEKYGDDLAEYDAATTPDMSVTDIEGGKNIRVELGGDETMPLAGRSGLIWLLYLRVNGERVPLITGKMKLDGLGFFEGAAQ